MSLDNTIGLLLSGLQETPGKVRIFARFEIYLLYMD